MVLGRGALDAPSKPVAGMQCYTASVVIMKVSHSASWSSSSYKDSCTTAQAAPTGKSLIHGGQNLTGIDLSHVCVLATNETHVAQGNLLKKEAYVLLGSAHTEPSKELCR